MNLMTADTMRNENNGTEEKMNVNVTVKKNESGCDVTIIDEPWATYQRNIAGLFRADGASYRGVQFTRKQQSDLGYIALQVFCLPNWREVLSAGSGILDISDEILEKIVAASQEIDEKIENAVPVKQFECVESDCQTKVMYHGDYCSSCEFDL